MNMDIKRILEYALQRENEGKRFFEQNASRLQNAAAAGAFKAIAAEAQKHIEFIQAHLNALMDNKPAPELELPTAVFFAERADSESIVDTVAESMVADLPVLRMAYLIERDFSEFYAQYAAKVDGKAKEILNMLAHWEAGHERLFKSMHDKAFELYSGMPWGG
jgi:rubrerythrin